MVPVYACQQPHASSGAVIGSAMHACPLQKGAIWVHVHDDADARANVTGVSVSNSAAGNKDSDGSGLASFDPLDEGSAYTIGLNPLSETLSEKYRLPAVVSVDNVPVRKGQITSVQLQVERVAPLRVIVKRSDVDEFVKDIDVEVTTTELRNTPATPSQKTPDSGIVDFKKLGKGSYKVALKLSDAAKKRYRIDGNQTQDWMLDPTPGKTNEVTFKLTPIIQIYLKLQFKDPEDNLRPFPKNFKFNLVFEAGPEPRTKPVIINDAGMATADGKAFVEVVRAAKSFKIDLKQVGVSWVVCEKRGAAKTQELALGKDPLWGAVLAKLKLEGRMFRLPVADWTLLNSRWDVVKTPIKSGATLAEDGYKFTGLDALPAEVGSDTAAVELTLKPAWQFLRFTYYDRKLKGDDPLSIPSKPSGEVMPVIVDGWRKKDDEKTDKDTDASCMWPLGDDDTKSVMCLPWIIGKDGTKADDKVKPDGETILRFKRKEAKPFIHTTDATDRKLVDFSDAAVRDKPSAARLAYYDLPKVWKSRGYFGWLSDADGDWGPYEDIAVKDTTRVKPLVFSLDDMVLTKEDLAPVLSPWDKTKRVALLSHSFTGTDTEPGGGTGPAAEPPANGKPQKPTPKGTRRWLNYMGLYNPDTAAPKHLSYFSKIKMEANYIADYPHWTRLVAMGGNLFDVFDQRTPEHATDVVGARAAVRWVDAVTGWPAGTRNDTRPARTDKAFFSVQPLKSTEYAQRLFGPVPYNHASPSTEILGRYDFALLRCCDFDGANEKAVNLVYFRMHFTYTGFTAPADAKYGADYVFNVGKRWNGKTGDSGAAAAQRVKLLSSDTPAKPIEIDHVWFGQNLPQAESHFTCSVVAGASGRSGFEGYAGTGNLTDKGCDDEPLSNGSNYFVGAHECGHGVGLEDDYCERWGAQSYGQLSFRWHLPGDPFEPDGRVTEGAETNASMMNNCVQLRNRYFWHCAEWVRLTTTLPMKVKLAAFDSYRLPPHPTADRNYAFWPIAAKERFEPDAVAKRGLAALYTYALGKESYTDEGLQQHVIKGASATFDGILVVTVNLAFTMPATMNVGNRSWFLAAMSALVRDQMNGRFIATGKVNDGATNEYTFARCLIHFSPRFLVENHADAGDAATLMGGMGFQFKAEMAWSNVAAVAHWDPATAAAANIQTLVDWQAATGGAARAPADPALGAMDTLIADYHALNETRIPERVTKLRAIVTAAEGWIATNQPVLPTPPTPAWTGRSPGVLAMKAAATTLANYLDGMKTKRSVKFDGTDVNDMPAKFGLHFPSMVGIYKPPVDVAPDDLRDLVRSVIPNGNVAAV